MKPFPFAEMIQRYKQHGRHDLPWRNYNFSEKELGYRVWLSEIFLQQTQASRVIGYFENVIQKYPTIEALAQTQYEVFFQDYQGLGYYSRARNMLKAAQIVSEDFAGIFPKQTPELTSLPGIGPYTAEAIRAFAYNIPTLSFDTNLLKIFSRYYFGDKTKKLSKTEQQEIKEQFIQTGISARDFNNACMDFANIICKNDVANINWDEYPLTQSEFYKTRGKLEPQKTKKKTNFPKKEATIIVILHEDHKTYFSEHESEYIPFVLPPSEVSTRSYVQTYFRKQYGLEVSVRPVHKKSFRGKKPYMVCYAQIQTGSEDFFLHEGVKKRQEEILERIEI